MLRKAKGFSLGIMRIYMLAYMVHVLSECVTFSRQSSTYSQPFNKLHVQIKRQQLYLITRLCCFSHFICTLNNNNKFSRSLAIRRSQLWGIIDVNQTDTEQTRKTDAKTQDRSSPEQRPNDKRSPEITFFCAIAAILTSGAAAWSAQLDWHRLLSGRTAPPHDKYTSTQSSPRTAALPQHLCRRDELRSGARKSRGGGEREKERKRGLRARVREGCAAQTVTFHFDNLITRLQLATEKGEKCSV